MEGQQPPEQWQKKDVQEWFKKKGWEDWGHSFLEANGNALIALSKEDFTQILGDMPGRAVYAAIQEEKNRGAGMCF